MQLILPFFILCVLVREYCSKDPCTLQLPQSKSNRPILQRHMNNKRISIPDFVTKIETSETLDALCITKFELTIPRNQRNYYYESYEEQYDVMYFQNVTLVCSQHNWTVTNCEQCSQDLSHAILKCVDYDFEFSMDLDPMSSTNGNQFCGDEDFHRIHFSPKSLSNKKILATSCYSKRNNALLGIEYHFEKWFDYDTISKLPIINNKFSISKLPHQNNFTNEYLSSQINFNLRWLNLTNYELHSIIQDRDFVDLISEHKQWFEVIWWHNLRVLNWNSFLEALHDYFRQTQYETLLTVGTLGKAQYPTDPQGKIMRFFQINERDPNIDIPAYIWAFLKLPDTRQIFVFGFNSPYFKFYKKNEVIFCQDECSTLDWLSHLLPAFDDHSAGKIFCCFIENVPSSIMQNLPITPAQNISTYATMTEEDINIY